MPKKLTQEEWVAKATEVHGDKYDYSLVQYEGGKVKVQIICKKHGVFMQSAESHLTGKGCRKCAFERSADMRRMTQDEFIRKAKEVHGDTYSYDLVKYTGNANKVSIICRIHGTYLQSPNSHLAGQGCKLCGNIAKGIKMQGDADEYIKKAKEVHGDTYDYSETHYIKNTLKIDIICKIHGKYKQSPWDHLRGNGCPKCRSAKMSALQTKSAEWFIAAANKIHSNKYDYSEIDYVNTRTEVGIICPKHGKFFQLPKSHLKGSGCSKCRSSLGEIFIRKYFTEHAIPYISEYRIDGCVRKNRLPFDFGVFYDAERTNLRMLVEFDGEQHFRPCDRFGGEKAFKNMQIRDKIKNDYCLTNNIKLVRIPYYEIRNIYSILDKELQLEN